MCTAAQTVIDAVAGGSYMDHHVAYSLGAASAQLGRANDAVRWLRSAADDGFACYPWFATDPLLEPIHQDAGYKELLKELRDRFEAARSRYKPGPA
jgi:serine/threonine-protein kinase